VHARSCQCVRWPAWHRDGTGYASASCVRVQWVCTGVKSKPDDLTQHHRSDSAIIARGHLPENNSELPDGPGLQRKFFWNKGVVQPADKIASKGDHLVRRHSAGEGTHISSDSR
jgi:hypothetical protein